MSSQKTVGLVLGSGASRDWAHNGIDVAHCSMDMQESADELEAIAGEILHY